MQKNQPKPTKAKKTNEDRQFEIGLQKKAELTESLVRKAVKNLRHK
jgi:hypothetical protein